MKTKRKLPGIVKFAILTTITVYIWIGSEVYRALTTKPDPAVPAEVLAPLNPALDTDALKKVNETLFLTDEEIGVTQIQVAQTTEDDGQESGVPSASDEANITEPVESTETPVPEEGTNGL